MGFDICVLDPAPVLRSLSLLPTLVDDSLTAGNLTCSSALIGSTGYSAFTGSGLFSDPRSSAYFFSSMRLNRTTRLSATPGR